MNAWRQRREHSIYALKQLFKDRPEASSLQKIIRPLVREKKKKILLVFAFDFFFFFFYVFKI